MPDVPPPAGLKDLTEVATDILEKIPMKLRRFMTDKRPFEFRPVDPVSFESCEKLPPQKCVWIRAVDRLPDDLALHQNLFAYVSDFELLATSTLPHGLSFSRGNVIMASLDHALWFHRDFRMDEWLLYSMDSPNAAGARGFARGQLFSEAGQLLASTSQEGLVRVVDAGQAQAAFGTSPPALSDGAMRYFALPWAATAAAALAIASASPRNSRDTGFNLSSSS